MQTELICSARTRWCGPRSIRRCVAQTAAGCVFSVLDNAFYLMTLIADGALTRKLQVQDSDLCSLVRQARQACPPPQPFGAVLRQTVMSGPSARQSGQWSSPGSSMESTKRVALKSLGQLYAQASVVQILLHSKARKWALASRGMGRLRQAASRGCEIFGYIAETEDNAMVWGELKNVDRAAEKAIVCYGLVPCPPALPPLLPFFRSSPPSLHLSHSLAVSASLSFSQALPPPYSVRLLCRSL